MVTTVSTPASVASQEDTNFHKMLRRLERDGLQRIRMFTTICMVYAVFWGPLFLVVAFGSRASEEGRGLASVGPPKDPVSHQVTLYVCFAHAFVNPTVFLALHSGLREAACAILACCFGRAGDCADPRGPGAYHAGGGGGDRFRHRDARELHHSQAGLVDYDQIISFNGAPSFLSPVPALPPLPPPPLHSLGSASSASAAASSSADSRPM